MIEAISFTQKYMLINRNIVIKIIDFVDINRNKRYLSLANNLNPRHLSEFTKIVEYMGNDLLTLALQFNIARRQIKQYQFFHKTMSLLQIMRDQSPNELKLMFINVFFTIVTHFNLFTTNTNEILQLQQFMIDVLNSFILCIDEPQYGVKIIEGTLNSLCLCLRLILICI